MNAWATSRWDGSSSSLSPAPCTRLRARLASCRVATADRPTMAPMSSNDSAKRSCSTKATRSAGLSVSSTTIMAEPTASASRTSRSGSVGSDAATAPSAWIAGAAFSRVLRARSMSRHTCVITVVSQPPRLSTALASARVIRSHVSCRASSASLVEPSMRYATARRRGRFSSNRALREASVTLGSCRSSGPRDDGRGDPHCDMHVRVTFRGPT